MVVIHNVREWQLINIDAVGLLTLLGVNSLEKSLGRLVQHPWAECLPFLAGHIIPDNLILEPIAGFTLYNVTDGIKVDGINSWFCRWVLNQELSQESTMINIDNTKWRRRVRIQDFVSAIIGFIVHVFLIVFCVLIDDWYGFAAAVSLAASTLSRVVVLRLCRAAVDRHAKKAEEISTLPVKVLLNLPNNKTVSIYTTRGVVIECLIRENRPENERLYQIMRMLGWLGFGVFIITLGLSCLAMQIIMVVLMVVSTVIVIKRIGCKDLFIGCTLQLDQHTMKGTGSYMRTYAALQLTEKEESAMVDWHLFPLKSNQEWWNRYHRFCKGYRENPAAFERMESNLGSKNS